VRVVVVVVPDKNAEKIKRKWVETGQYEDMAGTI